MFSDYRCPLWSMSRSSSDPKKWQFCVHKLAFPTKLQTLIFLSAFVRRLRTRALEMRKEQEVTFMFSFNFRRKLEPPLPQGYYGNVIGLDCAKSTAGEIGKKSLGHAVRLIEAAKRGMDDKRARYVLDAMEIHGRPDFTAVGGLAISDLTKFGFEQVDYLGSVKPVYGGIAETGVGRVPGVISSFNPNKSEDGVEGVILLICLPAPAMARFKAMILEEI